MNSEMEKYALVVLSLLYPLRSIEDIMINDGQPFPHTRRLQQIWVIESRITNDTDKVVFTDKNKLYLQRVQDSAYNSLRYRMKEDDLQSKTVPFQCSDGSDESPNDHQEEDQEEPELPYESMIAYLNEIDEYDAILDQDPDFFHMHLTGYDCSKLRDKGTYRCGRAEYLKVPNYDATREFITRDGVPTGQQIPDEVVYDANYQPDRRKIIEVFIHSTNVRTRPDIFVRNPGVEVPDANGSVASMHAWAKAAKMDDKQIRAFTCLLAAFILKFYDNARNDGDDVVGNQRTSNLFRQNLIRLKELRGTNDKSLILLLHGPGGSGKSTVINLLIAYAKEFCDLLNYQYTTRTIVVTAVTGVAATLLHGETASSAMGLNMEKRVTEEMIQEWSRAIMVIVDECSFGAGPQWKKMYHNCGDLMGERFKDYGGLNHRIRWRLCTVRTSRTTSDLYGISAGSLFYNENERFYRIRRYPSIP